MIYTITVNPSIDYVLSLNELALGDVNRIETAKKLPGGKGINVSRILKELGYLSKSLGFLGGSTGEFIQKELCRENIAQHFTPIKDHTRINVKIKAQNETELNAKGPVVTTEEQAAFLDEFSILTKNDVVIIGGSLCQGLQDNFYLKIIEIIKAKGAEFVIDTTGHNLLEALNYEPLLIKPNRSELEELFNCQIEELDDVIKYGHKLQELGAKNVLVSLAGDGAVLIYQDQVYYSPAPIGQVVNSVGAGDSMIAGFIGTYLATNDPLIALRYGVACGAATAFSTDLAIRSKINELLPFIQIQKV